MTYFRSSIRVLGLVYLCFGFCPLLKASDETLFEKSLRTLQKLSPSMLRFSSCSILLEEHVSMKHLSRGRKIPGLQGTFVDADGSKSTAYLLTLTDEADVPSHIVKVSKMTRTPLERVLRLETLEPSSKEAFVFVLPESPTSLEVLLAFSDGGLIDGVAEQLPRSAYETETAALRSDTWIKKLLRALKNEFWTNAPIQFSKNNVSWHFNPVLGSTFMVDQGDLLISGTIDGRMSITLSSVALRTEITDPEHLSKKQLEQRYEAIKRAIKGPRFETLLRIIQERFPIPDVSFPTKDTFVASNLERTDNFLSVSFEKFTFKVAVENSDVNLYEILFF
ncbi:MAG: hypothetical protein AB7F43_01480 [Bacteriovoracia bacterium]